MLSIPRRWRASWRDTLILFRQFGRPLAFFAAVVLGGGILYTHLARQSGEPLDGVIESFYLLITLAFLQSSRDFPHSLALQVFYFLMPLIGIGTLAQGLADFGIMLFNRRARSKEWEMAVASTFSKHTILIGLGHLGYRVVRQLHAMDEPVVVIELNPSADLVSTVQGLGIPVIQDDATRQVALEGAGVERARTIILCTQDDALNLQVAVKARGLNPGIRVVTRIFDDEFAQALQQQFGFTALSATGMAAPAFAAAAAGADVTRPINVEGQPLSLARLTVDAGSKLAGMQVSGVEQGYEVSVILLKHDGEADLHPAGERKLSPGDRLAVFGEPERINVLVHDSQ